MRFSLPSSINRYGFGIAYFDLFWLILSPFLALWARGDNLLDIDNLSMFSPICEYIILTIICGLPILIFFRINNGITHLCSSRDIIAVFSASSVSVLVSSYIIFSISRLDGVPRSVPLLYGFILFLGLVGYRVTIRGLYERRLAYKNQLTDIYSNIYLKKVVIVGLDQFSISAIRLTDNQRPQTVQIVSAISPDGKYAGKTISGVKVIGNYSNFSSTIDEYDVHGVKIDEVWFSKADNRFSEDVMSLLENACNDRSISFKSLEEALNLNPVIFKDDTTYINTPALLIQENSYSHVKRILDIIISSFLCLLLFPVFLLVCGLTLYQIGSPILFWQERIGYRGRKFLIYKVRTLGLPFNSSGRKLRDGERLSKFGLFIRRLRLDEIPQLLSILIGDMSGIGPRPLLPRDQPKENAERLLVRPGLTGWAQVNGGELLNIEEKNALDCWYVNHMSLSLDILIVFKTIVVLLNGVTRNDPQIQKALEWYNRRISELC